MIYSNPEMKINVFGVEDVVTESAAKTYELKDIGSEAGGDAMYTNIVSYPEAVGE